MSGDSGGSLVPVIEANMDKSKKFAVPKLKNTMTTPSEILNDPFLLSELEKLPKNYNFEVAKTVWRIKQMEAKTVALQMPEGLTMFGCTLADILETMTGCDVIIMGDVTYGACCIDDFTARALDVDLMVHYGHSCLIPVTETPGVRMLYVFVDIQIDLLHFVETILSNFPKSSKLAIVSTIQFVAAVQAGCRELQTRGIAAFTPQSRPLSPGEILGCTSPKLPADTDGIIYLGDGRFHIESIMIHNPKIPAFKYDPYTKKITSETYHFEKMCSIRSDSIDRCRSANCFGLILGTLGRQGSTAVLKRLQDLITSNGRSFIVVYMSEIFDSTLEMFTDVDCWVQVACPRLSIDWGSFFTKPLLTPAELHLVFKPIQGGGDKTNLDEYAMDYYARQSSGPWTPNNPELKNSRQEIANIENSLLNANCSNTNDACSCKN